MIKESEITRTMRDTGMGRMQAINSLRAREIMRRRFEAERRARVRGC